MCLMKFPRSEELRPGSRLLDSLPSCFTYELWDSGKLLNLSEPWFLHVQDVNGNKAFLTELLNN